MKRSLTCLPLFISLLIHSSIASPTRLELLRELRNAKQSAQTAKQSIQKHKVASALRSQQSTPRAAAPTPSALQDIAPPALPTKPPSLSDTEEMVWIKLVAQKAILHEISTVTAEAFAGAALAVKELIGPDLVGSDPRTAIANNSALQQLLFHVILGMKSREASSAGNDASAKESVSLLFKELFEQWQRLRIPGSAMEQQRSNVLHLYANWTDVPLTAAQEVKIQKLEEAAKQMTSHTESISNRTKAALALTALVGGGTLGTWLTTNGRARSAFQRTTRMIGRDLPEVAATTSAAATEAHNNAVQGALNAIENTLKAANLIVTDEAEAKVYLEEAREDLANEEAPEEEARKLTLALFRTFYANNQLDQSFKQEKFVHTTFFTTAAISMPWIARGLARMNELLGQKAYKDGDKSKTVADLILDNRIPLIQVLNLPASFFAEARQLPAEFRYPVAEQATNLFLALAKRNESKSRSFSYYLTPLFDAFDGLALATKDELHLFTFLRNAFIGLLNCIEQVTEESLLSDVAAWPALPNMKQIDPDDAPRTYTTLAKALTGNLKSHNHIIAANYRLRNIFINPETNSPVLNRYPAFNEADHPQQIDATTHLIAEVKKLAASLVEDGYEVVTEYAWSAVEKEVMAPARSLQRIISNTKKAFSRTNRRRLATLLDQLADIMAEPEHQGKRNAIQRSERLRTELMKSLAFSDDFWTRGVDDLDSDDRHKIATAGSRLTAALLPDQGGDETTAHRLGFNDDERGQFAMLKERFYDFALAGQGERERFETFDNAMSQLLAVIDTFNKENKAINTREVANEDGTTTQKASGPPTRKEYAAYETRLAKLNTAYTVQMARIQQVLNSQSERKAFQNHIMRPLLFTGKGGIRLTDIPEGLNERSRELTEEVLELIMDNPHELGYAGPNQEGIQLALRQLINDARIDDRRALMAMSPEVRDVYYEASEAITDLDSFENFTRGAKRIHTLLKNDGSRSIISENNQIYSLLISPNGLLRLPKKADGTRLTTENAFNDGGLTDMGRIFGLKLYEMALQHPKDLRLDESPLQEGLKAQAQIFKDAANKKASNATLEGAMQQGGRINAGNTTAAGAVMTKGAPVASTEFGSDYLSPEDKEKQIRDKDAIQSMLNFIAERRTELLDWKTVETGATLIAQSLDDAEKRKSFGQYPQVKSYMFSEQGFLIKPKDIPRPLNVESFEALFDMIDVLDSNPKELGYATLTANPNDGNPTLYAPAKEGQTKGSVITKDSIHNHLDRMRKALEDRKKVMDENDYTEETEGDIYDPRSQGIDPDAAIDINGALLPAEKVLGPRADSTRTAKWNDRQRLLYYWLYDEGFAELRARQVSTMYGGSSKLYSIVFELNLNEAILGFSLKQRVDLFHIINKPLLRAAFHRTIFPAFVPDDLIDPNDRKGQNPEWEQEIQQVVHLYERMIEEETNFAFDALQMKKARLMVDWLKIPEKAPTRNDVLRGMLMNNPNAAKDNPMAAAILMGNKDSGGQDFAKMAALSSMSGGSSGGGGMNPALMMAASGGKMDPTTMMMLSQGANPAAGGSGNNMMQTMMMMNMMNGKGGSSVSIDPMMLMAMNGGKMDPMMLMQMQQMKRAEEEKKELKEQIAEIQKRNEEKEAAEPAAPQNTQFTQAAQQDQPPTLQAVIQEDTRLITREMKNAVTQNGNAQLVDLLREAEKAESAMKLFEKMAIKDGVIQGEEADRLDTLERRLLQLKKDIEDGLFKSLTEPQQQAVEAFQQAGKRHRQSRGTQVLRNAIFEKRHLEDQYTQGEDERVVIYDDQSEQVYEQPHHDYDGSAEQHQSVVDAFDHGPRQRYDAGFEQGWWDSRSENHTANKARYAYTGTRDQHVNAY